MWAPGSSFPGSGKQKRGTGWSPPQGCCDSGLKCFLVRHLTSLPPSSPTSPPRLGRLGRDCLPNSVKVRLAWDPNSWLAASQAVPHSLLQGNRGSETAHKLLKVTELGLKPRLLSVTSYLFAPLLRGQREDQLSEFFQRLRAISVLVSICEHLL